MRLPFLNDRVQRRLGFLVLFLFLVVSGSLTGQTRITTPREQFGHSIGDDYFLVNYTELVAYWKKLSEQSDRIRIAEIGTTAEGRTMVMAIVTSAENHRSLDRYREIAGRLARAEGLSVEAAQALARGGKPIVWIDGGLHADETLGAQQLIEMVFQMASQGDDETLRILDDVVLLVCPVNPDGMELVSNWYMQESVPERRTLDDLPRLYEKYAGHDNNRDFYMSALPETRAINRVLYRDWFPQIVYDHHQTGPDGTVMFAPPFRDPFNFNLDPLVITTLEEVGAAMQSRFAMEGKPGVTSRSGATFSTWWNGGLRTSPYFHNMIGLLTETIGSPTPVEIPFVPVTQLPRSDLPFPIAPQGWHFRQSVDYSIAANRAVLDYASRNKDRLLFNIYAMGKNSIERGSRDSWTMSPERLNGIQPRNSTAPKETFSRLREPALRDPRGYVLSADQPDFLTATKFINALILNGVVVRRATAAFSVNGKRYPSGSYVVKTAQAFRPHILDMFEPQNHPDDFAYPGASPTPPYDIAGWTLAYQMGVKFDRVLEAFDGPFEIIAGEAKPPEGAVSTLAQPAGYLLGHETNDSFIAINRLLASGESIYWSKQSFAANGKTWRAGTNVITAKPDTAAKLKGLALSLGLNFEAISRLPGGEVAQLKPVRVGVWERSGGSVPSGWTRLILENFEFPFASLDSYALNGELSERFDVLIFPGGGTPPNGTTPRLKEFLDDGGTILAIGNSTELAKRLELPITEVLVEKLPGGGQRALPSNVLYVPGSILSARVDTSNALAYGLEEKIDLFFDNSPVFRLSRDAAKKGARSIVAFDSDKPLRSGWALGESRLKDSVAVLEMPAGKGKVILFGPEILFRAQPHGTFKLLFNAIYASRAAATRLVP